MIVDCAAYLDGKRLETEPTLEACLEAVRNHPGAFCRLGLFRPSRDELDQAAEAFHLHPLAVEDALESHQRPKIEVYEPPSSAPMILTVLKTLAYDNDKLEQGEISIFTGHDFVVSVRHGAGAKVSDARSEMDQRTKAIAHGPSGVLYSICDHIVDEYVDIVTDLEVAVDGVEQSVFSDRRSSDARAVFSLKRQVVTMRRAVAPLLVPLDRLDRGDIPGIDAATRPFFRDVSDHVKRVHGQIDSLDDLLTSILQAHLAEVSVQQNDDMRKISAWAAIIAIPTGISGIYGMNFDNLPLRQVAYGWVVVFVAMLIVCFVLYRWFKKVEWL